MCEDKTPTGFEDLEDKAFWDEDAPAAPAPSSPHTESIGEVEIPGFVENCPKCRGTGNWRPGYKCFKCKGTGKLQFKTSPEARGKSRKYAASAKVRNAAKGREDLIASLDEDVRDWLVTNEKTNTFAASLLEKGAKYGLNENQINGVRKCIARDADSLAGAADWIEAHPAEHKWLVAESADGNEFAESLLNGQYGLIKRGLLSENQLNAITRNLDKSSNDASSDLDISSLKGYYAVPDGDTRLKLCVRQPGKKSRYHGSQFVDDGAEYGSRKTYGKQLPGRKYQGGVQDELRAILADPKAAQVAYGKLTGTCGMCGRILEDEASVAAGIGPICAAKYG